MTQTHNPLPQATATFLVDLQTFLRDEDAQRYADIFSPMVVSGGIHGPVAGLTATPSPLVAYPEGYYTTETGSITYPGPLAMVWVVCHKDTTGNIGIFTRVPGTHYLMSPDLLNQPVLPAGCLWLMQVATNGGAVVAVVDLRVTSPIGTTQFFRDAEGTPADVALAANTGYSSYAARRDHAHRSRVDVPLFLTNHVGLGLVAGDVVALSSDDDASVVANDSVGSTSRFVVALATIADGALGAFSGYGVIPTRLAGSILRGNYLKKSATARCLEDAGVAANTGSAPPGGAVAVALSPIAGPGPHTLSVLFFGQPYAAPAALALPRGYLAGLTLSNNGADAAHDIDVAVGAARGDADDFDLTLAAPLTKQLDAGWAEGSAAGGLFTGAIGASTWYHVFLIRKDADGTIDAGFDTSVIAANRPVGWTGFRRIGSVRTDGASAILPFTQTGDYVGWTTPPLDANVTNLSTTATAFTLSLPPGARRLARVNIYIDRAGAVVVYVRDDSTTDAAPSASVSPLGSTGGAIADYDPFSTTTVMTNATAQIHARSTAGSTTFRVATLGWWDRRGRDD